MFVVKSCENQPVGGPRVQKVGGGPDQSYPVPMVVVLMVYMCLSVWSCLSVCVPVIQIQVRFGLILCLWVCVCMSVCLYVSICLALYVSVSLCVPLSMYVCISVSLCLSAFRSMLRRNSYMRWRRSSNQPRPTTRCTKLKPTKRE